MKRNKIIKKIKKEEEPYIFRSLREEILKRASNKKGITITGLTSLLSEHPERNRLTEEIHNLQAEGLITIEAIQIKQEANTYGGTFQNLIHLVGKV